MSFKSFLTLQRVIGVAWLAFVALMVNNSKAEQPLTYQDKKQVADLPSYVSTVASNENPHCQLQYECTRCLLECVS